MSNEVRLLCDLGWLNEFAPDWRCNRDFFLDHDVTRHPVEYWLREFAKDRTWSMQLTFLEQLVVSDKLQIDAVALRGGDVNIPVGLEGHIVAMEIPVATYRATYLRIMGIAKSIRNGTIPPLAIVSRKDIGPFEDTYQKAYHDALDRHTAMCGALANSNDSLGRALFYLELSNSTNLPVLLSENKREWLSKLHELTFPSVHDCIRSRIDKAFITEAEALLGEAYVARTISLPPIAEMIVRRAHRQARGLHEIVSEMKASSEAASYRNLVAEMTAALRQGRNGMTRISELTSSLSNAAKSWVAHSDLHAGIDYKPRQLHLSKIPTIGWLFEMFGLGDIAIRDKLLTDQPLYLAFIASWYGFDK